MTTKHHRLPPPPHFNIVQKIWREVKRPFRRFRLAKLRRNEQELQTKIATLHDMLGFFDNPSSEAYKTVNSLLRFYRWQSILGGNTARFLRIPEPHVSLYGLFAQHVGIDLEKEIRSTDECAVILDGIKFPHPLNEADCRVFEHELSDVVIPSYYRHNFENFDRYSTIFEDQLRYFCVGLHDSRYSCTGPYEYGNVYLEEGDIVFDIGANMGLFSAVASRYGAKVFAFEAIPGIINNYLSKTANMNGNIHIQNFAVWDKEETLTFSYIPRCISASRVNQFGKTQSDDDEQLTVQAIPLDTFVEKNGITRVDFIKVDIEGAERNMLRGARKILKDFAPKLSICSYHLPDDPQVLREIILEANPNYTIIEKFKKMYAYVPNKIV